MLPINSTGIRSGEFITSRPGAKQNEGSVFQIRGFYPPARVWVDQLTLEELKNTFNQIPFFIPMTLEERKVWLLNNSIDDNDLYVEDVPDLWVKIIRISGKFVNEKLTPEQIETLLKGNPDDKEGFWHIRTLFNMFPRKPGSRAAKPTLIFRPGNWTLSSPEVKPITPCHVIEKGIITFGMPPSNAYVHEFENSFINKIAVVLPPSSSLTWELIYSHLTRYGDIAFINNLLPVLKKPAPSILKSLLQKLIRTRCKDVSYFGIKYPGSLVTALTFITLALHPGVFVPDIQRFVTGLESATKRLMVSICEDSFTDRPDILLDLLSTALYVQNHKEYKPSLEQLFFWADFSIQVQQDTRCFLYDWHNFINLPPEVSYWHFNYLFLKELKSFDTDIKMLGSIAFNKGIPRESQDTSELWFTMPLVHCVDQHCLTQLAHFMNPLNIPYPTLFNMIWDHSSSVNPRKDLLKSQHLEEDPFTKEVRLGQRSIWASKYLDCKTERLLLDEFVEITCHLDPSLLSGMFGAREIKLGTSNILVVLRTDDIDQMTVVRRPSRDKDLPELTETEKENAISLVKLELSKGIILPHVPSSLSEWKGAKLYYSEDKGYIIQLPDKVVLWEDLLTRTYKIPLHSEIPLTLEQAILTKGEGIQRNAEMEFINLVKMQSPKMLRRLIAYLECNHSVIELFKISRDGTGQDYSVRSEDTEVFHFLAKLSVLFPICLMLENTSFKVKCGPLLWYLREKLSKLVKEVPFECTWKVPIPDDRIPYEYQKEVVDEMIKKNESGKRGHLVNMLIGSGKTLIVVLYIQHLILTKRMPKYCVYVLPPEARESVIKEFMSYQFDVLELDMTIKGQNKTIVPNTVCFIKRDHLRRGDFDENLREISSELLFIIDEVHGCMAKTIRSSIALEVSKLAVDFIGLSGTMIRNDDPEEIIQWLSLCVPFELDKNNFWVAVGMMYSRKIQLDILIERNLMEIPFTLEQKSIYDKLVPPSLGGVAEEIKFKESVDYCYQIITPHLVNLTKQYISLGENVFLVAKDLFHMNELKELLVKEGITKIGMITKDSPINYTPQDPPIYQVIITTIRQCMGYNVTRCRIMLTSVYFSNQSTRSQVEGRIIRVGQLSKSVRITTVTTGLLGNIFKKYESARNLSDAIKAFCKEIHHEGILKY